MESIDAEMCDLLLDLMLTDFLPKLNIKHVERTICEIRRKYKGEKEEKKIRGIQNGDQNGDSALQTVAKFYEYSSCLASSTSASFTELLTENLEFFQKKMAGKVIDICCIAGGVASEMVAAVKMLCSRVKHSASDYFLFRVSFISIGGQWNAIIESVMRKLEEHLKEHSRIKIITSFVSMEVLSDVLDVFHGSDIIISATFSQEMSGFEEKRYEELLEVTNDYLLSLFFN